MICRILVVSAVLIAPSALSAADSVKDEVKKLVGTWIIVSVDADGETRPAKDIGEGIPKKFKISAEKIDSLIDREALPYSIDPLQKPKHMDVRNGDSKDAETIKWIYALDGDDLKLAVTFDLKLFGGEPDRSRPKSFDTKGNKTIAINLKREKK